MDSLEEVSSHEVIEEKNPEKPAGVERDTRSSVLEAFNSTYESFQQEDTSTLSPDELAKRKAEINLIGRIKSDTVDKDKKFVTRTYTDRTGTTVKFTESPPIRHLLEHAKRVLENPDIDDATKEKFEEYRAVLYRNSRQHAYTPSQLEARIDHELSLLENNPDLTTGDPDKDNRLATELFAYRFDLILPKKEREAPPAPPVTNEQQFPDGVGEIPAQQVEDYLGTPPTAETTPTAVDPQAAEPTQTVQEIEEPIPILTWKNNEYDEPVQVTGYMGVDPSGREYASIEGSTTGIPLDEIEADDETKDRIRRLGTAPTPDRSPTTEEPDTNPSTAETETSATTPPTVEPEVDTEEEEPAPTPLTVEAIVREIMIANRTLDIRERSADLAEKHLRAEQKRGKIWNPLTWARKTKLRVLEEYYRQQYMKEASTRMLESNNSYLSLDIFRNAAANVTANRDIEREAGKAKIEQLKTGELTKGEEDKKGEKVSELTGDLKQFVLNEIVLNDSVTEDTIQQKLREFAEAHKDNDQVKELFGVDATRYGEVAKYFATDILETRKLIKEDLAAHKYARDRIDDFVKIKLANANWAYDTQVQWTMADKAIAWSQRNNKRGWITNPAVVGAAASIGLYGGMRLAGYSGKALITAPLVGTAIGATFAAVRRAHDLKIDRASHQVERAYGAEIPAEDAKRRKTLEKYALETVTVDTLLRGGSERTTVGGDTRGMEELMKLDLSKVENRQALLQRTSEIRSRLDYSASNKIDLLTYNGEFGVEQGRLQLIKAVVEAKKSLEDAGIAKDQIKGELDRLYGDWSQQFLTNREQQDKAFNRYRVRQSLITAGIGGASGLAVGLGAGVLVREAIEHSGGSAHLAGLEKIPGLNRLMGESSDNSTSENMNDLVNENKPVKVGNVTISLDTENHVVTTPDGGTPLVHENWTIDSSGHIKVDVSVPSEIQDQFKGAGFEIQEHTEQAPIPFNENSPLVQDNLPGFHHQVFVPEGTGWIQPDSSDPTKWDLVISQHPDQILVHNAVVTPDGESINYDASASPFGENAFTSRTIELEPAHDVSKEVFGPEGLWSKDSTPIDHREWYGNNTRYSDLNELRAYNSLTTASNGEKVVDWDMSHMQPGGSFETGNHPENVNPQEVIGQGRAALAFSTPDHQQDPIIITDASDGVIDGHFKLDPTDNTHRIGGSDNPNSMTVAEFSKMVLNQQKLQQIPDGSLASELTNRQDVFTLGQNGKPGFIEAGRLVDLDGKKVFQPFATAAGTGDAPASITVHVPAKMDTVIDFPPKPVSFDHTVTEIIPPADRQIPIIPTPITPRFPLEPLAGPIMPPPPVPPYYAYGYGLEVLSTEQQQQMRARYSKRLRDNPEAQLDADVEISEYFTRQNADHMQQLEEYLRQPGMNEVMNDNCDAVVCIPVYDLGEGGSIGKTLEQYLLQIDASRNQQAISPEKFELLLFLNHPEGKRAKKENELGHQYGQDAEQRVRAGTPMPYDTEEVIRQFQLAHPELKIRVMKKEYDGEQIKPWGTIIKDLYDSALLRSARRANPVHKDPLILTNDADLVNISPTYLRDIIQYMDHNDLESTRGDKRRLDAVVGKIDMPNQGYEKEPGFLAAQRLYQFIDAQQRKKPGKSAITQGRNTIIRGSAYAAIGGPLENYGAGADTLLGGAIRDARKGVKTVDYINKAWLYSDPRRELEKWQNNVPLAYAWNNWGETNIYGEGWQDRFRSLPKNTGAIDIEKLQRDIAAEAWRWGLPYNSPEMRKALAWLGLKPSDYHIGKIKDYDVDGSVIEKDGIVVDNTSVLEKNLKDFQTEKRWEKADRRIENALNRAPTAPLNEKFSAEYTDFEEFDRLKADIFGVMGDGSDSEYPWKPDPAVPSPTVIDLGAHMGVSILWWKTIAPNAKIIAVEANPGLSPLLESNTEKNGIQSDVRVIQGAVSPDAGNVKFFSPKAGQGWNWEGFIADTNPNPSKYDEVDVPTVQLSTLINGPVDLLKLDIEGSEVKALKEAESKLSQVKEIMMEYHNNPDTPENSFNEALSLLQRQGYDWEVRLNNQPITDFSQFTTDDRFNLTILAKRPNAPSSAPRAIPQLRPSSVRPTATLEDSIEVATPILEPAPPPVIDITVPPSTPAPESATQEVSQDITNVKVGDRFKTTNGNVGRVRNVTERNGRKLVNFEVEEGDLKGSRQTFDTTYLKDHGATILAENPQPAPLPPTRDPFARRTAAPTAAPTTTSST